MSNVFNNGAQLLQEEVDRINQTEDVSQKKVNIAQFKRMQTIQRKEMINEMNLQRAAANVQKKERRQYLQEKILNDIRNRGRNV